MSVKVKKGSVLVYRIFDIAEEIKIPKAEASLKDIRGRDTFKVPKFIDRGIVVKSRPVAFGLGEVEINLKGGSHHARVLGKVHDYGVLSLIYQIPLNPGTSWSDLVKLATDLEEGSEVDQIAQRQAKEMAELISPALIRPTSWDVFEDYIIYFLEEFEDDVSARNLSERADIPALLLAESETSIASAIRKGILENVYQYGEEDLAFVEWNSALVVEPKGGREVPDILEFAVTQLLEMRYYDELLEKKLGSLYDSIEQSKGRMVRGKFHQIYQEASSRYIEFAEFIERVENSLKVVGDFYLATVYRAATRRFRLTDWQMNITRKMNLLAQVSNLLQGEINMRRSHWLEFIIIVLIAIEVIPALFRLVF
jgi:hypothetical protein